MHNEKLRPENLVASTRSPVIPEVEPSEKAQITKELGEKAKVRAERKAERLKDEAAIEKATEAEKAKIGPGQVGPEQPKAEVPMHKKEKEKLKKTAPKAKKAELTFPTTIKVNAYGFIGLRKSLLASLGWHKTMTLSVVKNEDGSITVRKA